MRLFALTLVALALLAAGFPGPGAGVNTIVPGASSMKIIFAAAARDPSAPGLYAHDAAQMIYTLAPGGTDLRQITAYDGYTYDWPTWAFGGTRIVYTRRSVAEPDAGENLFIMDADGSNPIQLTHSTSRNVQPKVSPDGLSIVFSAFWPEYPPVALFKLDLATLTVVNISAATTDAHGSDPRWIDGGRSILFVDTQYDGPHPTQVFESDPNGGARRRLGVDQYWNTDPAISPDGRLLAVSSYRGSGTPQLEGSAWAAKLQDWHLVVSDLQSGGERVLTQGLACASRIPPAPICTPTEAPAWVPLWSPDGKDLAYVSVRNSTTMGIYLLSPAGGVARTLYESTALAISWFDWTDPAEVSTARVPVIGAPPEAGLLISAGQGGIGLDVDARHLLDRSTPDRWSERAVTPSIAGLEPLYARWTPDRRHIVFTARQPIDPAGGPAAPPSGQARHVRYTLPQFTAPYEFAPDQAIAEEQVYLMDPDGRNVRQLTTPWTEDFMEAAGEGDLRANVEPDVSPDGRYVIFTNISTAVDETMILRLDLHTGEVLNLSSMTAGALTVRDAHARFSPDGAKIVLSSTVGASRQLLLMRTDGTQVRQITNDDNDDVDPAWSPDGRSIAFSQHRADADPHSPLTSGWQIVRMDTGGGQQKVLAAPADSPAFRPAWSPDGRTIVYISASGPDAQSDLRFVDADGANDRVQTTLVLHEAYVDWR